MTAPACGSCGAPVSDARLCTGCTRDLAELLLQAASIAPDLDDAVARLLKRGSGGRRSEADAPLPIDLGAMTVAHELRAELACWVDTVRVAYLPTFGPACVTRCAHRSCARIFGRVRPLSTIASMAPWLALHLDQLRQSQYAAVAHREIRAAVDRALAAIDRKPERAPAGLCDNCGRQLLAELGADSVTCGCGMTVLALQDKRRERAAAADVLGTPAELATVLATLGYVIAPGTISAWGTRGQIEKRAGGVYRLSEALTMAAKTGTRRARVGG